MPEREEAESIKRLNKLFISAILLTPFILSTLYSVAIWLIFFASNPDPGNILYGIEYLRNVPEERYEFGIVALAALQATIFIGAQNRALGKEESVRAEEANYIFNKFAYSVSLLISLIIFCILIASIGNFSFWIALVIFWISASLISLFYDSSKESRQRLAGIENSLGELEHRLKCLSEGKNKPSNKRQLLKPRFPLGRLFSLKKRYLVSLILVIIIFLFLYGANDKIYFAACLVPLLLLEVVVLFTILWLESQSWLIMMYAFSFIFVILPLLIILPSLKSELTPIFAILTIFVSIFLLWKIRTSKKYKERLINLIAKEIYDLKGKKLSIELN